MNNLFLIQFDILVPNYLERGYFSKQKNKGLNHYRKQLKLKTVFKNSLYHVKFQLLTFNCFLGSVIMQNLSTTASSSHHNCGLVRHRKINYII